MANFTIRVYGILINSKQEVLVTDEFIRGNYFTKFPGGGLEFGEGTRDCLVREFMEEANLPITVGLHLYTTDFFQISAFNQQDQIVSVYYFVHANEPISLQTKQQPFDFEPHQTADSTACAEVFRWIPLHQLSTETVHLPIDKVVVGLLKN